MAIDSVFRRTCRRRSASCCSATFAVAIMNLIVDVVYAFLDPRVRYA